MRVRSYKSSLHKAKWDRVFKESYQFHQRFTHAQAGLSGPVNILTWKNRRLFLQYLANPQAKVSWKRMNEWWDCDYAVLKAWELSEFLGLSGRVKNARAKMRKNLKKNDLPLPKRLFLRVPMWAPKPLLRALLRIGLHTGIQSEDEEALFVRRNTNVQGQGGKLN